MSLKVVIQILPEWTDYFVEEILPVLQSLFPYVRAAALNVTFLALVFVAYKWKQNPNSSSSEVDGSSTVGGEEAERTPVKTANQRSQNFLNQLKSIVTKTWINKLEERLKQSYILEKQLENELETARRDLELTDRNVWQKDEEVNEITQKLKEMTEDYDKQQSLLQESKREAELEEKPTEAEKEDVKQSEAEVLQQLKTEQMKREEAEKHLQELKAELDTKTQKLESFSKKVEILHETMKKTEESQQVLMKELENHKDQKTQNPEQSAAVEEPELENLTSEITELRKELRDAQAQSEVLTEQNQQLQAQLDELKETYKHEFEKIIAEEQKWTEELQRDVKVLRNEYVNQICSCIRTILSESKTSEEVSAPAEEEEIHEEDS
ncbi:golgin subfamily A member 6-like protein 22 isoform X2 [Poeciliopsis prolifica]|uniref:golgin subfamily A member 6-like protein 22 isoform X2 n=1 Tax=Poeciliopsis prolifica TaxID=188132 RepID=UPI0024143FD8|nr:golgin subfamily A member 6-like protein 22 isoform X2 [Poeciliopsis prolifica]